MKTLYLECGMGAAGDMLMAALSELLPDRQLFLDKMNSIGIPGVNVEAEKVSKCGISGTHMNVSVYGEEESQGSSDSKHNIKDWRNTYENTCIKPGNNAGA